MNRSITFYSPGPRFPSISVTGRECQLGCRHCRGVYLRGMTPARDPEELERIAWRLSENGGEGFLLSGGATPSGAVPLTRYADAIRRIKELTALRINAHVGLMRRNELSTLIDAGVDAFSIDVYGSDAPIGRTLGLEAGAEDFLGVVIDLIELGAPLVVPHLCAGIHEGRLEGEFKAIDMLMGAKVDALVIIVFSPTKGTPYASLDPPEADEVLSVIAYAKHRLRGARLCLGCMRPRNDRSLEVRAAYAGVTGMAVPSVATREGLAREGWKITEKETCCALSR